VPELNGRIVRMIHKKDGKDLLSDPDSGQLTYPNLNGFALSAYPDYHSRQAMAVRWKVESSAGREAALIGTADNGLVLRRTISLVGGAVVSRATAENRGSADISMTLQGRLDLDPGASGSPLVSFRRQDGQAWERKLSDIDRDPAGPETFLGAERPDGEVRIALPKSVSVVRFQKPQAERVFLSWSLRTTRNITLGLWSAAKALRPGETLRLEMEVSRPR